MTIDFARLGFQVDTGGLVNATAAMNNTTQAATRLGVAADSASMQINEISVGGKAASQSLSATAQAAKNSDAQMLALARSIAGANASLDELVTKSLKWAEAQGSMTATAKDALPLRSQLTRALNDEAVAVQNSAEKMSMMAGAAGGLAGVLAYQLLGAVVNVVSEIASIPVEAGRAADAMNMLEAKLKFAFQGSADAARQARADIIRIAQTTGIPFEDLAAQYSGIASAGRAAGLTRGDVSGLTGAFAQIGMMTGADSGQIGRAQWQLMQSLAIGRLNGMDFRQMRSNLPGINDALAAGLGVNSGQLQGMVSRGEVSADRLVQGIIRGTEILSRTADSMPETMERASGRLQTQWQLLLADMGKAINSSGMVQSMTNLIADAIEMARGGFEGPPPADAPASEQARYRASLAATRRFGRPGYAPSDDFTFMDPRFAADSPAQQREAMRAAAAQALADARTHSLASGQRADTVLEGLDPYSQQRGEMQSQANTLRDAINDPNAATLFTPQQLQAWRTQLTTIEAQIARIGPAFLTMSRQARQAMADLATYGAGPAFDMAQRARGVVEQSIAQNNPVSMAQAMAQELSRALIDARNRTGAGQAELDRARSILLPAAGQGREAQRLAAVEMQVAQFRASFGPLANTDAVRSAVDAERARLAGESLYEAQRNEAGQFGANVISLDAERRRIAALGDPRAQRSLERQLQREAVQRDMGGRAAPAIDQLNERFALEDMRTVRERAAADQERLRALREQLTLVTRLGAEGRVEQAQAERMRELRALGLDADRQLVAQELERVRLAVQLSDQLEVQSRRMDDLADAASTAGHLISNVLSVSIESGVRNGTIHARDIFNVFTNSVIRMADDIMQAFMRPFEKQATDAVSRFIGNIIPGLGSTFTPYVAPQVPLIPGFANGVDDFGGGLAWVGEHGMELVKLPPHSSVTPNHDLPKLGGDTLVQVIDQRRGDSAPVDVQESRGPNGERMVRMFIRDAVKDDMRGGQFDKDMATTYGAQRAVKRV